MNYGERLASWYLRLNGFIPMPDFVLHRLDRRGAVPNSNAHHADVDLLAVRFPHVHEDIGGEWEDWDRERLTDLLDPQKATAVIVEVKSGPTSRPRPDAQRLDRAVRRLGLLPREQVAGAVRQLTRVHTGPPPLYRSDDGIIGTMLVCPARSSASLRHRYTHVVSLETCDAFIRRRMETYRDPKFASRLFFPDELIQYLAWKAGDREGQE